MKLWTECRREINITFPKILALKIYSGGVNKIEYFDWDSNQFNRIHTHPHHRK